jgi:chromosome segregation ATPase
MDPLSLTASIITVVGLAGEVGKNLRRLHHISAEIHSLINDVSDLQAVLAEVDRVVIQYQVTAHAPEEAILNLSKTVQAARRRLTELNEMILESGGADGKAKVARLKWIRAKTQAASIQQSLRDLRMNLVTILGTLCS